MTSKASLSLPELVSGAEDAIRRVYVQSAQLEVRSQWASSSLLRMQPALSKAQSALFVDFAAARKMQNLVEYSAYDCETGRSDLRNRLRNEDLCNRLRNEDSGYAISLHCVTGYAMKDDALERGV